MINKNFSMDRILHKDLRLLSVYHQKHETGAINPPIRMYINKSENRITFIIKTSYYLELLIPETLKFLGNMENKITKYKKGK